MTRFITFCFFLLMINISAPTFAHQQAIYDLYVLAKSGLSLRAEPNLKAKKVNVLPYGTLVDRVDTELHGELTKIRELQGFYMEAKWMKVSYKGNEGYIYAGYLSRFPPANVVYEGSDVVDFDQYIEHQLGILDEGRVVTEYYDEEFMGGSDEKEGCAFRTKCNLDLIYEEDYCREAGASNEIYLTALSLQEAYLVANMLFNTSDYEVKYNKTEEAFIIQGKNGAWYGCEYVLHKNMQGEGCVIDYYCGC